MKGVDWNEPSFQLELQNKRYDAFGQQSNYFYQHQAINFPLGYQQQYQPYFQLSEEDMIEPDVFPNVYKILLVGDSGVGKTTFLQRHLKPSNNDYLNIDPTQGVQFVSNEEMLVPPNKQTQLIQYWDTSGRDDQLSITQANYRRAVGAFILFDVCDEKSFSSVKQWVDAVRNSADPNVCIAVIGHNKNQSNVQKQGAAASQNKRVVTRAMAEEFVKNQYNMKYYETSSSEVAGINQAFASLLLDVSNSLKGKITKIAEYRPVNYHGFDPFADLTDVKVLDGTLRNIYRKITDKFCCLIFLCFFIIAILIGFYAVLLGSPSQLLVGYDPDHNGCGLSAKTKDYPYIYFATPTTKQLYRTVCVKTCPNANSKTLDCMPNSLVTNCIGLQLAAVNTTSTSVNTTSTSATAGGQTKTSEVLFLIETHDDTKFYNNFNSLNQQKTIQMFTGVQIDQTYVYDSQPFAGKVCLPVSQTFKDQMMSSLHVGAITQGVSDLSDCWEVLIYSFIIALLIGAIFAFLMKYLAGIVFNIFYFAIVGLLGFMAVIFFFNAFGQPLLITIQSGISQLQQCLIGGACIVIALLITLYAYFKRDSIKRAIVILEASSQFLTSNLSVLLLPPIVFVSFIAYFAYWFGITLYLYSIGTISDKPHQLPFGQFKHSYQTFSLGLVHFFQLFWNLLFILGMGDFILCSATSIWYFNQAKQKASIGEAQSAVGLDHPFFSSIYRFFRYHMGSVAYSSSLVMWIVWPIQAIMGVFAESPENMGKPLMSFIGKCCNCCVGYFNQFIRFLSDDAFTQIAVNPIASDGSALTYYTASKRAFGLLRIRYAEQTHSNIGVGVVICMLGRITVAIGTAAVCYVIIAFIPYYKDRVANPLVPTCLFGLVGLVVGSIFMSIYGTVGDSILQLFMMDQEACQRATNLTGISTQNALDRCPKVLLELIQKDKAQIKPVQQPSQQNATTAVDTASKNQASNTTQNQNKQS